MTARPFSLKLSPHGGRYRVPPPGARISIQALLALSALIVLITSFASSAAHSTTLLTQSQEPMQHTGVVPPPTLPPIPSPAERLAEVLAQLPGFVPPLNTSDTDTFKAACPTHLSDWRVAHNPRLGGYDLVTYGPGEFISDVCLRGGEYVFWEERMSNFILGLLRGGSAPSLAAAAPPAAPLPPPTTTTNPGNASSLLATMPWFLDIGSNLGVHTVAVARAGFPVVAIDANPTAIARLRCSLALNALSSQVTLLHLALGVPPPGAAPSAPAFMCLKVQDPKNVGQNHLVPCSGSGGDTSQQQQQQQQNSPIPLLSLDSLLLQQRQDQQQQQQQQLPQPQQLQQPQQPPQQHPLRQAQFPLPLLLIPTPPTVVKMDVEGFEGWVLQGGKEWFGRVLPPFILMELNPHLVERAGGDWRGILDFWLGLGYHVFSVGVPEGGAGGGGREITREDYQSVDAGAALMEANSPVARCNFDFVIKRSPGGQEWPGGWPEKLCYSD